MPHKPVSQDRLTTLRKMGIHLHGIAANAPCHPEVVFEPPVQIGKILRLDAPLRVGAFSMLHGPGTVVFAEIGRYCSIAQNVTIGSNEHPITWMSSSSIFENPHLFGWSEAMGADPARAPRGQPFHASLKKTVIGNDVWIGHGVFVKSGVTIGDGAIVGAMANVIHDVPPYAIVAGNPARVIRYRFTPEQIVALLQLRWWRHSIYDMPDIDFSDIDTVLRVMPGRDLPAYAPVWEGIV